MAKLSINTSNIPPLPEGLKDLGQFGRETFDIVGEDKFLIFIVGGSALDYWPHYEKGLFVENGFLEGKNYEVEHIHQSDIPRPNAYFHSRPIDHYREVLEDENQINPIGCYKAIAFDNTSRTYKSLAGFWKWFLPIANRLSMEEVSAFVIADENGGSNSTADPKYRRLEDPKTGKYKKYKGPHITLTEATPSIYKQLEEKKLTHLISRYISPTHLEAGLRKKLENLANKTVNRVRYSTPEHQKILGQGVCEAYA